MRTLLFTATVLLSSAAFGQFGQSAQVQVQSVSGTDTLSVGSGSCGTRSTFNWRVTGSPCADLSLWITSDTDCKDSASAQTSGSTLELPGVTRTTISQQGGTGTGTFNVSELPIFSSASTDAGTGQTCGAEQIDKTVRLCASTKQSSDYLGTCNTVVKASSPLKITYDTKPPGVPTIDAVGALDQSLRVEFSAPSDAASVRLVVLRDGATVSNSTEGVGSGPFRVSGLENEVTYQLQAYSIDAAGNQSSDYASAEGTPIRTLGFFEKYREAGGQETGGCGAAGGGLAGGAVLAALGFWLSSRRNRS